MTNRGRWTMTTSPSDLAALKADVQRTGANLRRMRVYWGKRPTPRFINAHLRHIQALERYRAALQEAAERTP